MHHHTILDGEMVVDHDPQTGMYTRRYLIYDLMVLHGESLSHLPFKVRYFTCLNSFRAESRILQRVFCLASLLIGIPKVQACLVAVLRVLPIKVLSFACDVVGSL